MTDRAVLPKQARNDEHTTCPLCDESHDEVLAILAEEPTRTLRRISSGDLADQREYLQREMAETKADPGYSKGVAALHRHRLAVIDGELERRCRLEEWGGPKIAESGLVPQEVVEEIKRRTDLAAIISEDLGELVYRASKSWFRCKLHGRDSDPSLAVYEDGHWWCYGCNDGGDVFDWLLKARNMEWRKAAEYLAGQCGVVIPKPEIPTEAAPPHPRSWQGRVKAATRG